MDSINPYNYVQLTKDNLHHLVKLFRIVLGVNYSYEYLYTKYFTEVEGLTSLGYFVFLDDEAVAFYGGIPVLMEFDGNIELAVQCSDAMTLKEHRGKGFFSQLDKLVNDLFQSSGVRFKWALLNQNSEFICVQKLNWDGKRRMKCFTIPVATLPTEKFFRRTKVFEKQNQDWIRRKLSDSILVNRTIQSIDTSKRVGVSRDKAYFDSKSYTPNLCVDVEGTAVWIKPVGGLLVGDMEMKSQEQVLKTVEGLKRMAQKIGVDKVIIQVSEANPIYNFLSTQYSSIDSWLIGYKNINSNFPLKTLDLTYGDLDTF